jgi:hypothetical protein
MVNTHKAFRGLVIVAVALAIGGCAPTKQPELLTPEQFAELSVPLDIREYRTVNEAGTQAVFIKLSRLPDGIGHHVESASASIVLDVKGPAGPNTVDEESLQGTPPLSRIRVARGPNLLRLSLDLERGEVPPYSVHLLADWIMVRLESPDNQG